VIDLSQHADAPPILDVLQAMCDRSLLGAPAPGAPAEPRFTQLVTMREYAWEKLVESGQAPSVITRHVAYFVDRALRLRRAGGLGRDAWAWLDAERENLLAAHARALSAGTADGAAGAAELTLALEPVLWVRGPLAQLAALVDAVLQAPVTLPAAPRADVLRARANVRRSQGRRAEAARDIEESLALAAAAGDPRVQAPVVAAAGRFVLEAGHFDEAAAHYEAAREHARTAGDRMGEGRALQGLANVEAERNAGAPSAEGSARARELYAQALVLLEEAGDVLGQGVALGNLGGVLVDEGHLQEARDALDAALAIHESLGDRRSVAVALVNLGSVEQERAHVAEAAAHLERALAIVQEIGYRRVEGVAATLLGGCLSDLGRHEEARRLLEQAMRAAHETGDARQEALAHAYLVRAQVGRRQIDDARAALARAEALAAETVHPSLDAPLALARGHVDAALARQARDGGDPGTAGAAFERASVAARAARGKKLPLEGRVLLRSLDGIVEAAGEGDAVRAPKVDPGLIVGPDARWFQPPDGARVGLETRKALRLLLSRLADHRADAPGEPLAIAQLFEAGWPGERVQADAATSRVYVALSTLRKMGLEAVLLRRPDGYLLDPGVPLVRRN
jgi:tetratricopeptide (TPR) repeat protein